MESYVGFTLRGWNGQAASSASNPTEYHSCCKEKKCCHHPLMLRISYITKVETQNALRNAGPQWQKKPRERLSQKKMDNRLRDQIGLITDGRMEAMRHGSKAATRGGASSSSGLTPTPAGSKVLVVLGPHEKVRVHVDMDASIGQLIPLEYSGVCWAEWTGPIGQ